MIIIKVVIIIIVHEIFEVFQIIKDVTILAALWVFLKDSDGLYQYWVSFDL
jgi:hypothetical protein